MHDTRLTINCYCKIHNHLGFQVPCYSEGLVIYFYDNY